MLHRSPGSCCPSSELWHWVCTLFPLTSLMLGAPGAGWEGHTADPMQWKCWDWGGMGQNGEPHTTPSCWQGSCGPQSCPILYQWGGGGHAWPSVFPPSHKGQQGGPTGCLQEGGEWDPKYHLQHPCAASRSLSPLPPAHTCVLTRGCITPSSALPLGSPRLLHTHLHSCAHLKHSAHPQPVHAHSCCSHTQRTLTPHALLYMHGHPLHAHTPCTLLPHALLHTPCTLTPHARSPRCTPARSPVPALTARCRTSPTRCPAAPPRTPRSTAR